jgi:hypothetical protein
MDKGFKADEGHTWNEFTSLAMSSTPEDVCDDIDILSMMVYMALRDILPPKRCYRNTLCTVFHLKFASGDRTISMEEISRGATAMILIDIAQQSSPSSKGRSRNNT